MSVLMVNKQWETKRKYPNGVPIETRFCACNCGKIFECKINSKQKYLSGHNNKGKKIKPFTEEHKNNIRLAQKGKKKKPFTEKHKQNISNIRKGKTWEEIFGKEKAIEIASKRIKALTGKKHSEKTRKKISDSNKKAWENFSEEKIKNRNNKISEANKNPSLETRKKQRVSAVKRIEKNHCKCATNYNKKACEIFKSFDEANNTKGRYAIYGDGEYCVYGLGYHLDYINLDKKIIIEIYEKHHFNKDGTLRNKDVIREQEIKEFFPDFKFYSFKDTELNKILEIKLSKGIFYVTS